MNILMVNNLEGTSWRTNYRNKC